MKKIAIIDYNLGNLFSVNQACNNVGLNTEICDDPKQLDSFDGLILPGVGSFEIGIKNLKEKNFLDGIKNFKSNNKPIFGICLGMQLLFERSEEFNSICGLSLIQGEVKYLNKEKVNQIPHVGWNSIKQLNQQNYSQSPLSCLDESDNVYFVHSLHVVPKNESIILSNTTVDNHTFASSILCENIFATQFHPEKSGSTGLKILKEWGTKFNLIK